MEKTKEKLYLCLSDDYKLSLQTRLDVDSWIKDVEEADGSLDQTVIGSIDPSSTIPYFFFTFKYGNNIISHDIISAASEYDAKNKLLAKKRYAGKRIEFKRSQDISELIRQYYS